MNIILTTFSSHRFLFTEGDTLRDAVMPWLNENPENIASKADILDVLSGTGFKKEDFEQLGFQSKDVIPFDIRKLYNIAAAGFSTLNLNRDWILDYNNGSQFKFCPYMYSFMSGNRRFYVLNLGGNPMILSNYRRSWGVVPLKHSGDQVKHYVPVA